MFGDYHDELLLTKMNFTGAGWVMPTGHGSHE